MDHVAPARRVRIAAGGQHDAHGRARVPVDDRRRQARIERGIAERRDVGAHARKDGLRLRVAQPAVELEHFRRAVRGDHQAGVEEADVRRAFGGERTHRGPHDLLHCALVYPGRDDRRGGVGAHATGVRPEVAVVTTLVILRRCERQHVAAIHQRDETRFLAFEELLDHDRIAGRAEATREHRLRRRDRLVARCADHDSLARRETVRLDDQRRTLRAHPGRVEILPRERGISGRRDRVAAQEFLHVGLGALEPGGRTARPEAAQSGGHELVGDAEHQRPFGTDDRQVDLLGKRKAHQPRNVVGGDVHVAHAGLARRSGIARRDEDLRDPRRLRGLPRERVLAAAGADDQDLHLSA